MGSVPWKGPCEGGGKMIRKGKGDVRAETERLEDVG